MLDDANRDAHAVYCLVQSDFGGASGGLPLEHSGRQLELFDIQSRAALRQGLAERDAPQQGANLQAARPVRALRIDVVVKRTIGFPQLSILPTTIVRRILLSSGDRLDELLAGGAKLLCRQTRGFERERRGKRDGDRNELPGVIATVPEAALDVIEDSCELAESGVAATHERGVAGRDGRAHRPTIRAAAIDHKGRRAHACPRVD